MLRAGGAVGCRVHPPRHIARERRALVCVALWQGKLAAIQLEQRCLVRGIMRGNNRAKASVCRTNEMLVTCNAQGGVAVHCIVAAWGKGISASTLVDYCGMASSLVRAGCSVKGCSGRPPKADGAETRWLFETRRPLKERSGQDFARLSRLFSYLWSNGRPNTNCGIYCAAMTHTLRIYRVVAYMLCLGRVCM